MDNRRVTRQKGEKRDDRLTLSIPEFAAMTGCSRHLAYYLARQDKLPVPVIKLGDKRLVVSRKAVERLLSGEVGNDEC
jgi:predicted DNA-binding transcriptional regulator AlpA